MIIKIINDERYRRLTRNDVAYLFPRDYLTVQRYNSVAFKGTFLVPTNWTSATPANLVFNS